MIFEICNNIVENLLMSSFIAQYIHLRDNNVKFIFITTLLNALISTVLTQLQIVGFTQTLAIQVILWIGLYVFHKNFSWQDIIVSLYCNILLFFSVYFGYLILSLLFHVKPCEVYINQAPYIAVVFFSKSIFIALLFYSLKKRPLLFTNTKINKLKHLLSFELLMIMLMAYYFISYVLSVEFSHRSNVIVLCFIFLFVSFALLLTSLFL